MAGFVLCFGIVLVGERMDRTIKAPGDVSLHLQLPELGVIPQKEAAGRSFTGRIPRLLGRDKAAVAPTGRTWHDEPPMVAESFRNVVVSLRLPVRNEHGGRLVLVTSPRRGDGKSTTVANLGVTLAETGQRVLLIDGDMRQPRLHEVFELPNTWGLSDLLRENSPLNEIPLEALIRKTEVEGLHVLPSGPGPASISSLLYSRRLVDLLDRFRSEYDVVLIDTPPMFAISDARVLAQLADGTILVIRSKQTTRDMALAVKQRLLQDGTPLIGTILVAWDGKQRGAYYRDSYASY